MLFYTSLFIASLIVALVILWLYNALMDVGRTVYQAILPSSKQNLAKEIRNVRFDTTINETPTPWGWESNQVPQKASRSSAATSSGSTPWGWPGNDNEIREHGPEQASPDDSKTESQFWGYGGAKPPSKETAEKNVGWPYREEKFDFAGQTYKVKQKRKIKKTNLSKTGKPWGW